jgi:gamma-glutamyltranspeptidase/glutathione hydrolase
MVASAHELASTCGATILSKGGNVIDAAIATSAALCVVQNNSCGLGGDAFALIKFDGKVVEINGSGRAAKAATIDFFESRGYTTIPEKGPLSCITVPGLVHACGELLRYASMDLPDLLAPAIEYAEKGVPLNAKYVESISASIDSLGSYAGWRNLFMPDGRVPEPGFVLKQRDLARSLKMIASEGTPTFYEGELAERIARGVEEEGGLLDFTDLKDHTSTWKTPISTDYRGTKIYENSPNSQAATVLLWLNMLEKYDLGKMSNNQDDVQELLVRTCLKAYEERAKWIADPSFVPFPSEFIMKEHAMEVLASPERSSEMGRESKGDGDTTYFAVGDREGNCVSMIQSNYMGFGSGIVPRG